MKKSAGAEGKRDITIIIVIVLVAAVGSMFMILTKAATPVTTAEAENGNVISPATKVVDASASNGTAVKFNANSGGGGVYKIIGSGDVAKSPPAAKPTGDQIKNMSPAPDAVFVFGDVAYEDGTMSQFTTNYEPYWGSFKNITYPAPGNHDYHTSGAADYYKYFSATATSITGHTVSGRPDKGYYAWNIGTKWRFYSLNTEANQAEANTWLDSDLAATRSSRPCQVGYWHQPAYTSPSHHGNSSDAQKFLTTMYKYGGDIAFFGHNHVYERLYPIDGAGKRNDTNGIISMTIGTGGAGQSGYEITSPIAISAAHKSNVFGNILLTARDNLTFNIDFLRASGDAFTDATSGTCHP